MQWFKDREFLIGYLWALGGENFLQDLSLVYRTEALQLEQSRHTDMAVFTEA